MQFKIYFFRLSKQERKEFAEKVGTSVGHLTNFCYGYTSLAAKACVLIERESKGEVSRRNLMPNDWHEIWPELAEVRCTGLIEAALCGQGS